MHVILSHATSRILASLSLQTINNGKSITIGNNTNIIFAKKSCLEDPMPL